MAIESPRISKSRAVEVLVIGAGATAGILILERVRRERARETILFERRLNMRNAVSEDGNYGSIGSEEQTSRLDEAYFV